MVSIPPPGAKPTMKVSFRFGNSSAPAGVDAGPRLKVTASATSAMLRMCPSHAERSDAVVRATLALREASIEWASGLELRHRGDQPLDVLRPRQAVVAVLDQGQHHV